MKTALGLDEIFPPNKKKPREENGRTRKGGRRIERIGTNGTQTWRCESAGWANVAPAVLRSVVHERAAPSSFDDCGEDGCFARGVDAAGDRRSHGGPQEPLWAASRAV